MKKNYSTHRRNKRRNKVTKLFVFLSLFGRYIKLDLIHNGKDTSTLIPIEDFNTTNVGKIISELTGLKRFEVDFLQTPETYEVVRHLTRFKKKRM